MFKEFGQFAGLLGKLPKIKEEMGRLQQRMGEITADGTAGGDMVRVKVNGKFTVLACSVSDEAAADRELLEDLFVAATNQALEKVRKLVLDETQKSASELGLPPGLNLPGLT